LLPPKTFGLPGMTVRERTHDRQLKQTACPDKSGAKDSSLNSGK
jgi:hypothetical protein